MRERLAQVLGGDEDGLERMDTVVRRFWWSGAPTRGVGCASTARGQVIELSSRRAARTGIDGA